MGILEKIIAKVNLLRISVCKGEVNFLNKFKYKIHFHRESYNLSINKIAFEKLTILQC